MLAEGYAPAVGFIHAGKALSFVYDIADVYKFETVVLVAFKVAASQPSGNTERAVRLACRDVFQQTKLLDRIIPDIEEILSAGEIAKPDAPAESVGPALPNPESMGDVGHRS